VKCTRVLGRDDVAIQEEVRTLIRDLLLFAHAGLRVAAGVVATWGAPRGKNEAEAIQKWSLEYQGSSVCMARSNARSSLTGGLRRRSPFVALTSLSRSIYRSRAGRGRGNLVGDRCPTTGFAEPSFSLVAWSPTHCSLPPDLRGSRISSCWATIPHTNAIVARD
jgi:hypothetical protein